MSKLLTTFQERFGDWLTALGQHLQLSLLTLLVAIFLTIPLAVYLNSHKKVANWVLQVAGIFQTIPSMALVGSLYSFHGDWNLTGPYSSSHLCYFPDFGKYNHSLATALILVLRRLGLLLE